MPEPSSLTSVAFAGLCLSIAIGLLTWLASLARHDVSLVDRVWSLSIVGAGLVYFFLLPARDARGTAMALLGAAWALRLSIFITARNWGHGEERRYQDIRKRNEPNFAIKSIYLVFALQAFLAWIVSAPFLAGMSAGTPLGVFDYVAMAIVIFGIVFEAIADAQMSAFRSEPSSKGQIMDRGLWRYTRHPNYFGEACTWWGLWLMAMSGASLGGAWSVVSPLLMTVLLLKVSGVSLTEKDIGDRRPGYREYIERTNAFIPGPARKASP